MLVSGSTALATEAVPAVRRRRHCVFGVSSQVLGTSIAHAEGLSRRLDGRIDRCHGPFGVRDDSAPRPYGASDRLTLRSSPIWLGTFMRYNWPLSPRHAHGVLRRMVGEADRDDEDRRQGPVLGGAAADQLSRCPEGRPVRKVA